MDLRVVGVFALGVAVGAVGAVLWMQRDVATEPIERSAADRAGTSSPATRDPGLAAGRPATGATPDAPDGAAATDPTPGTSPRVAPLSDDLVESPLPSIEVVVASGDGVPDGWQGTAYALPAGSPGADAASGVARTTVGVKGPARLLVPAAGRYDVGVAWPGGALLVEDVVVDAGSSARAAFSLPACAPVRVVVEGDGPKRDGVQKAGVNVRLVPRGDGPARAFPGRKEHASADVPVQVDAVPGAGSSPPVPIASTFDVEGTVWLMVEMKVAESTMSMMTTADDERLAPRPESVHGGGEVRLVREELGVWRVRFRTDPSPWPASRLRATLRYSLPHAPQSWSETVDVPTTDLEALAAKPIERRAASGTARLAWSGAGIAPGETTASIGGPGTTTETVAVLRRSAVDDVEATLQFDVSALPEGAGRALAIGWAPGFGPGVDTETPALAPSNYPRFSTTVRDAWQSGVQTELAADWRRATGVMAVAGRYVSRPTTPPAKGDWRPVFELGGTIVVVPDPSPDPSLGSLFVRRADGAPLLVSGQSNGVIAPVPASSGSDAVCGAGSCGASPSDAPPLAPVGATSGPSLAREEVLVEPGTTLGPILPGEVVLEARIGSLRLPPSTVRVRGGRITSWELRWRK